ncbi:MAG: DUF1501 domain-containing protein [Phycisphaerales bacterium]|nr:MAG: DUF1501 domain-containing protein [Phycisphaerales bacterium]
MKATRRDALRLGLSGVACFCIEATVPRWILRSAQAMVDCLPPDRILIILQQAGGNDGLNMVIPRTDETYYDGRTRPSLQIPRGIEINLDGLNGFHPRLDKLAGWFQQGIVGIVQNVGYENPNFSHFTSTDYWEFGTIPGAPLPKQGWVARFYDNACAGAENVDALLAVVAGTSGGTPDALNGMTGYAPPTIDSPDAYDLEVSSDRALRLAAISALNSIPTLDPHIDFLQRSQNAVEVSTQDIAVAGEVPLLVEDGAYTSDSLGQGLKLASQIIRAGFGTRIFYVRQGGYDTHANQVNAADPANSGRHAVLMSNLNSSIDAFLREMELSGNLDRVLIMTFSEFGRRVAENGSAGTDHGAGNCLFVIGGQVRGGVYGGQPDLNSENLIRGNLRHRIDFRTVYARVIESWFETQALPIFGQLDYDTIILPQLPEIDFLNTASLVQSR